MRLLSSIAVAVAIAFLPSASHAAEVADYRFNDTLHSSIAGAPALQELVAGGSFVDATVGGQPRRGWRVPFGTGFALDVDGLLPPTGYSIVLQLAADSVGGYQKLFDMRDGLVDDGLYLDGDELGYYPYFDEMQTVHLQSQEFHWLVMTRSPAGELVGYVDGAEEFRYTDQDENTSAVSNSGMVTFFHDDTTTSGEHFEGVVTRIRLFDTVLTPPQVAALTAIPPLFRDGFEG